MDLEGLKVVVDSANGAAYKITPQLLHELGAEVISINDEPDGVNINLIADRCISTSWRSVLKKPLACRHRS